MGVGRYITFIKLSLSAVLYFTLYDGSTGGGDKGVCVGGGASLAWGFSFPLFVYNVIGCSILSFTDHL